MNKFSKKHWKDTWVYKAGWHEGGGMGHPPHHPLFFAASTACFHIHVFFFTTLILHHYLRWSDVPFVPFATLAKHKGRVEPQPSIFTTRVHRVAARVGWACGRMFLTGISGGWWVVRLDEEGGGGHLLTPCNENLWSYCWYMITNNVLHHTTQHNYEPWCSDDKERFNI